MIDKKVATIVFMNDCMLLTTNLTYNNKLLKFSLLEIENDKGWLIKDFS